MLARRMIRALSPGSAKLSLRQLATCAASLVALGSGSAAAQPTGSILPAGPTVSDWQPRGRAAVGTRIVITGPAFVPADFVATIGGAKIPLPVRLATSTSTRIELDVPQTALGQTGALAISQKGFRGSVLETSYVIDALRPAIEPMPAITSTPFRSLSLNPRVREFPGATLNNDQVTVGGTCGFVKSSTVSLGTRTREPDLSIGVFLPGWFERSGSCTLQLNLTPIAPNGSALPVVQVSTPLTIPAPTRYTFDNTSQLTARLAPALVRAGIGSTCEGTAGGGAVGVTTINSDLQLLVRGGALDVACTYRTAQLTLADGVRLTEMRWVSARTGERCGPAGTVTTTLPTTSFQLARGSVLVNPTITQPAREFFVFGDGNLVVDGVTLMTVQRATSVLLPMVVDLQCVSMAVALVTASGTLPPTTSPQSFGAVLDRVVFEGPPGLSLATLFR